MAGWSTVARLPFTPVRAADDLHRTIAGFHNLGALFLFYFSSAALYCLYAAHLAWVRMPKGAFVAGLVILGIAVLINTFVYVVIADILGDRGRGLRRILPLLVSTLAISGAFNLLGAAAFEAGVLGLWKIRRALAILLLLIVAWQGCVEIVNLRRNYAVRWWWAGVVEIAARGASTLLGLTFIALVSGHTRPWKHWKALLWVFGW